MLQNSTENQPKVMVLTFILYNIKYMNNRSKKFIFEYVKQLFKSADSILMELNVAGLC